MMAPKPEIFSRIAQATAALTKLKPIWRDNNVSLESKVKLMRSLVIFIFLYACESWTLIAELEKRTKIVWPRFKVFWFSKDNSTGHSERTKKKRQTEEEVGRQYQKSGQEWTLPAQLGRLKTGQGGKGLLRTHLWCPDDLPRLWDSIEIE